MANLTITAANVGISGSDTRIKSVIVSEAVTQGQGVYYDTATNKYTRATAGDVVAKADARGIVLTPAGADGQCVIATGGLVIAGATLAVGTVYVVSATVGLIAPIADMTTGDFVTILGVAKTTSVLELAINASGTASA